MSGTSLRIQRAARHAANPQGSTSVQLSQWKQPLCVRLPTDALVEQQVRLDAERGAQRRRRDAAVAGVRPRAARMANVRDVVPRRQAAAVHHYAAKAVQHVPVNNAASEFAGVDATLNDTLLLAARLRTRTVWSRWATKCASLASCSSARLESGNKAKSY